MNKFLIFIGGFVVGILATLLLYPSFTTENKPIDDGIKGLTMFSEKGDCIKTTSKMKSSEIEIFQVIKPNTALGRIKYYTDIKMYDDYNYRDNDYENEVVVLLINHDGKTYYDDQKIDVSNKCLRQVGTFQFKSMLDTDKTVPVVVLE